MGTDRPRALVLIAAALLFATSATCCATGAAEIGESEPDPGREDTSSGAPARSVGEPATLGGYQPAIAEDPIVLATIAALRALLADGIQPLLGDRHAPSVTATGQGAALRIAEPSEEQGRRPALDLQGADLFQDVGQTRIVVEAALAAATQVVAGTNVWVHAAYSCGDLSGELAAIIYWTFEGTGYLTDLNLAYESI